MRIVEWTGGDAPDRNVPLTVSAQYVGYMAYWEPGYCGCPDCRPVVGWGKTEREAIDDYWERWGERYK